MGLKTGLAAQFGMVKESTYGSYLAPTRFIDFVSADFSQDIDRLESKAIRTGKRVMMSEDWAAGKKACKGNIELEIWNKSFGLVFEQMFGGVSSASATGGVYNHTFTPGDLPSATYQVGVPGVTGTVAPFSYTGMKCDSWELDAAVNEFAKLKLSVVGQGETTAQGLASASYATGIEPLTFVGASLTIAGTGVPVNKVNLKGENGLAADRYFIGSQNMSEPLEADLRKYSGTLSAEFTDTTLYARYTGGTECALVLTFAGVANPTHKLVVTTNVRFDGDTPKVSGPGIVENPMKFVCVASSTTDGSAITAVYTTPDTTP